MVLLWICAEHFLLLDYINFLFHHNSSNRKASCLQSLYSTVNFSQAHPNPLSWLLILLWPRMKEVILIFARNREEGLCGWTILYRAAGETKTACPDQKSEPAAHQTRKAAIWWSQRTRTTGVRQFSWQWRKSETGQCCHRRLRWDIPEYQLKLTEKVTWPLGTTGSHI